MGIGNKNRKDLSEEMVFEFELSLKLGKSISDMGSASSGTGKRKGSEVRKSPAH